MEKKYQIGRNISYTLVLGLILAAWLSPFNPSPKPARKENEKTETPLVVYPVTDRSISENLVVGGDCNIETINGTPLGTNTYLINLGTPLRLTGWGMDKVHSRLPHSVLIRLTSVDASDFFLPAKSGLQRSDVKRYFSLSDSLLGSGFELNTKLQSIPTGEYSMTVVMMFTETAFVCDNGRKFRIQ